MSKEIVWIETNAIMLQELMSNLIYVENREESLKGTLFFNARFKIT